MHDLAELLGESPTIKVVRDKLRWLLDRQQTGQRLPSVLLQGDTGTGKGLVAHLLHRYGRRHRGPFVDVNCAAIPETLLEAELFGFERGAFTDASRSKPGLFQAAHGGVLFLDEVGLLPESSQGKLLAAIEQRAVRRLGSTRPEAADVWLISATNADLRAAVRARRFREDLYHRMAVLTLDLPALRDRGRDVVLLAERFLTRICAEYGLTPKYLDPAAQARLLAYSWPGNVRELANVIERAALFADTSVVTADILGPLEAKGTDAVSLGPPSGTATSRDEAMRQRLLTALEQTQWNIAHTAARLGIARNTVYARLEKFGLRPDHPRKTALGSPRPAEPAAGPLAPTAGLQWEQRSITLLRADLSHVESVDAWSRSGRALEGFIAKVQSFGGRVEEVAPTGLVAAFGIDPAEDAPRRAAHAAMAMQKSAQRARESSDGMPGVTIGLHVAALLIGRLGTRIEIDAGAKRAQWPVLDQLLEGRAPGETVASAAAASFLERRFELAPVDGQGPAYRFTGQESRGLGLWGAMTRFVGRREELELLRSRMRMAGEGHGQVVAIVGEAGVGKSRVIYEFARAQRPEGWRVLEGTAVSYGRTMSYLPVIDLLKGYFSIEDRDDPREIREKITGRLLTLDAALQPTLPAVLALLDVPTDERAWQTLDPPQRRQRMLDAVRRLLLQEAREQPMLLIFEDLHWIDGETQALLDGLVATLGSSRLLLLVSYRPEYQHPWGSKTSYSQIRLDALPVERAGELLDALLGEDPSLAPVKQLLVKRGNPFFLEETVRTLAETKALAGERGLYRLTQPVSATQVPAAVQVILAARIDRLAPEDRHVLQMASVVGKDVPFTLLRAIAGLPDEALSRALDHLQAAEFVYEARLHPDREYSFKHALTHEVAYSVLLAERRRTLHGQIVDAIERLYPDRLSEHIERLAHHAFRGELHEKAVHYLREAGEKAAGRSALQDARGWFERALEVLAALPDTRSNLAQGFEIRLELRRVLSHLGEVRSMLERLREAEAIAERLKDDGRRSRVAAFVMLAHTLLGDVDKALAAGTDAMEIAQRLDDPGPRLYTATLLAQTHYYRGDYERAAELATGNVAILAADWTYERSGSSMPIGFYDRYWLVLSLVELGRLSEAARYAAEGLRLVERTDHAFSIGLAHWSVSKLHLLEGDWVQARSGLEHRMAALRNRNITLGLSRTVAASAWVLSQIGEGDEALTRLREGTQLLEREAAKGTADRPAEAYHALSRSALLLGRLDEARDLADHAVESSPSHHGLAAHAWLLLGDIATHPDHLDAEAGDVRYRQALALAAPRSMRPLVAHCHLGLGKLYRRTGKRDQAHDHLATATTMYGEMHMPFWREQAEAEMGELT
jgi:transcriptional regulator with AAA-type ATPase domain/tetratricopeptide (TPR) repeat protein